MLTFILRRLLTLIPLLLGISFMVFLLMKLSPGDFLDQARAAPDIPPEQIEAMEVQLGLTDADGNPTPWYVQYGRWLANISPIKYGPWTGEPDKTLYFGAPYFGESWTYKVPVFQLLEQRVPATFLLSLTSILFAWCIAIPLGVLAAMYKDSIFDRVSALLAYAALSIPEFFLAILAVYFAASTGILPFNGRSSIESEFMPPAMQFLDYAHHLILPTIVLGVGGIAGMMRIMRANFIDVMHAEYATTARAKGLSEKVVMFKHVLRNAINPLVTALGFAFASLLSGALLVENVMNYPGLGQLMYEAILREDQYVVMAAVVVGATMLILGNLLADLFLGWLDPRIRLEDSGSKGLSPKRIAIVTFVVIALLGGEIALEHYAPFWRDVLFEMLKYAGILLGGLLALGCISLVAYVCSVLTRRLWKPLMKRPIGVSALVILALMYAGAAFAPFLSPNDPTTINWQKTYHPPTAVTWVDGGLHVQDYALTDRENLVYTPIEGKTYPLKFFSDGKLVSLDTDDTNARLYLLGSDDMGRDVFSRLLHGARISLTVGLLGISVSMVIGFTVGSLAGYFGGTTDFVIMRLVEFLMSVPALYLLLALRAAFIQPDTTSGEVYLIIVLILSIIGWAGTARVIRGMSLSLRNRQFILAAESMGQSPLKIMVKHILPNIASYLLVSATLAIPGYILGEAALSFLGLGITEPTPSWGLMLKASQDDMKTLFLGFWWLLAPGFGIFVAVISYNVLGDVLRDIVDPKRQMLK